MNNSFENYQSAGILELFQIRDLAPEIYNSMIVGVIIGKQRPRKFEDNKSEENRSRAVWNFTLRDSERDYINVTYWGTEHVIFTANEKFCTGDVVEIIKSKISIRKLGDSAEQYRPSVTSPYFLTLGEQSEMQFYNGDTVVYKQLLQLPTKPIAGFVPIRDIQNEGANMKGRSIDLLGAVRSIGTLRTINTRLGQETQLREIVLFDHTSPGIKVTIWETDVILRAAKWVSRSTVVFITDIRVEWSNYNRCYSASLTNRSIVTENPSGEEVNFLKKYAKNAPLESSFLLDQINAPILDPSTIQNVMCVKQLSKKIENMFQENAPNPELSALLYVFVTKLDLDGQAPNTTIKCGQCNQWLKTDSSPCANVECPVSGQTPDNINIAFDIKINLSDHTGTLPNCRLIGQTAENVLGCSIKQFLKMTDDEKCNLKWKYLMERCAVRVVVLNVSRGRTLISILTCERADPMETAQRISLSS